MEISRDDDVTGNAPGELINAVQGENIVVAVLYLSKIRQMLGLIIIL